MESVIEIVGRRVSCRSFDGRPLEPMDTESLRQALAEVRRTPFGNRVRFTLLDLDGGDPGQARLGTYGVIRGARTFLAGAVMAGARAMEDFGHAMETMILRATEQNLGTCWLGGTFSRSGFASAMNLTEDEIIPAVTPVGYPAGKRTLTDRIFRFTASSDKRMPWGDLFFSETWDRSLDRDAAGPWVPVLECVRLGPSASNKQPWRILRRGADHHLFLKRTPRYGDFPGGIRLQNVDLGIAMCHFEAAARELGLDGQWAVEASPPEAPGREYIATWKRAPAA
ncbi:MAG TPA: nitroreductase family protein [Syntrophales bacterium]|nr:nitroreductase family protein [Syntrophales bacterium]